MTEYTDKQLSYALINSDYDRFLTVSSLRAILDALPDPQDEWQQCRFEDIRKGDRVKVVRLNGDLYEATVTGVGKDLIQSKFAHFYPEYASATYRIPAPAVNPTPEAHPVIIVRGTEYGALDVATPMIHDGGGFYESPKGSYKADIITDWSPAKVVPDDE